MDTPTQPSPMRYTQAWQVQMAQFNTLNALIETHLEEMTRLMHCVSMDPISRDYQIELHARFDGLCCARNAAMAVWRLYDDAQP